MYQNTQQLSVCLSVCNTYQNVITTEWRDGYKQQDCAIVANFRFLSGIILKCSSKLTTLSLSLETIDVIYVKLFCFEVK